MEKFTILLILIPFFGFFTTVFAQNWRPRVETCRTSDGLSGKCKKLSECIEVEETIYFATVLDPKVKRNELVKKHQGNCRTVYGYDPNVCCKDKKTESDFVFDSEGNQSNLQNRNDKYTQQASFLNRLPDTNDGCGVSNATFHRVVGGQPAQLGAWPWIVLLGYKNDFDEIEWRCGGTLITQRHVLTASHCIRKDLHTVRLGEHDLSKTTETKHIDVLVDKWVRHSDYSSYDGHADIAVVTLKNPITFTKLISPICLPKTQQLRSKSFVGYQPFVAGWGRTQEGGKTADILQQLQIEVFPNPECSVYYKGQNALVSKRQFDSSVVCAGVLAGKKDVCQGDSGGPLMFPHMIDGVNVLFQLGVISHGIGCARPGLPSVFMSISHYYDWIEDKVKTM